MKKVFNYICILFLFPFTLFAQTGGPVYQAREVTYGTDYAMVLLAIVGLVFIFLITTYLTSDISKYLESKKKKLSFLKSSIIYIVILGIMAFTIYHLYDYLGLLSFSKWISS